MESTEQQPPQMKNPEPQPGHRWLQKLVGEWTAEGGDEPGQNQPQGPWTETVRSIGEVFIVAEGRGEMPGGEPGETQMTLGYDPERDRFTGTFAGSMMTHLWIYDGELDESETVLTLHTEGPDFEVEGRTAKYRDIIEFTDNDHRVLRAVIQGEDGTWKEIMKSEFRRTK